MISGWMELPPGCYRLLARITSPKPERRGEMTRQVQVLPDEASEVPD